MPGYLEIFHLPYFTFKENKYKEVVCQGTVWFNEHILSLRPTVSFAVMSETGFKVSHPTWR